ncbi:ABC transporter A family member 2-like protein [Drosera capensis]
MTMTSTGAALFFRQTAALLRKNAILAIRNKKTTLAFLLFPFAVLLLVFVVNKGNDLARRSSSLSGASTREVRDAVEVSVEGIRSCEEGWFVVEPCFDFVWSGNGSDVAGEIVRGIMEKNPGRPIPDHKVKSFATEEEVDQWLFAFPQHTPVVLHLRQQNATVISYGIETNTSTPNWKGRSEDPTFKFLVPLQVAAEREIARFLLGEGNFNWTVGLKKYPHPNLGGDTSTNDGIDFGTVASICLIVILQFSFTFQLHSIVAERELKLRQIAIAFFLTPFVGKASNALNVGFLIAQQFVKSHAVKSVLELLPQSILSTAIILLSGSNISWSQRTECLPSDDNCELSLNGAYIRLTASFFVWLSLALYVDNIFPGPNGVRKPLYYFLKPGYWTGKDTSRAKASHSVTHTTPDDEDVIEEENKVKQQMGSGELDSQVAVQIRGLVKTYYVKRRKPFHAVGGLWINFDKDQLFCLLGPNGAGKTTAIGCLTGVVSVTGGDALIYGNSIRSSVGMSNIRKTIGVCPQFDILWKQLSGKEHLELFANIKGLPASEIETIVQKSLSEVGLTGSAKVRAGSYSGGMRRRLSVAIALLGDPKLVILDEPTTGMDPISRRQVWDIIENAKKGRAIILTTHSMEEADVLGDRIGIMARGRLRCVGTSIRLKSKFGTGFIANVSFRSNADDAGSNYMEATKKFFKDHLDVNPKEENNAFLTYVIPREKEGALKIFFAELQDRETELGISDIQLGLTTLEEVFLNIAKQAELETATAEGRTTTITLSSGTLIPIGARFIAVPGTENATNPSGIMVEVYWAQDDSGSLCVSGQSDEMPVPPNVPLNVRRGSQNRLSGKKGEVQGIVIDPIHIEQATQ